MMEVESRQILRRRNRYYKKSGYIVSKTTDEGYRYGYVNIEGKQIIENKYNDLYRVTDIKAKMFI